MLIAKGLIVALMFALMAWFLSGTFAQIAHGDPIVLDGDSLEFNDQRVDLLGVDAPELQQTCIRGNHQWGCGAYSTAALLVKVRGRHVWCFRKGEVSDGVAIAKCYVGFTDVARAVIDEGWAVAGANQSRLYQDEESAARLARKGIWSSTFAPPAEWRAAMSTPESQ